MLKKRIVIAGLLALVIGVFALPTSHAQDTARLRLVHAVANATPVDLYVDGTRVAEALEFGEATEHLTVPAGAHTVEIRLPGSAASDAAAFSQEITLEPALAYSWILQGDPSSLQPFLYEDVLDSLDLGFARVGIVHAAPTAPTVDVVRADIGFPVVTGVSYNVPYGTLNFPVGVYDLVVAPTGGTAADAIAQVGKVDLQNGVYYTFVITPDNTDPTQTTTFVLESPVNPAPDAVLTRFAHAVAEAPAIDVYLNDILVITNLSPGEFSPHVGLPAGDHELALREAGAAPNSDPIFTETVTVGTDSQTLAVTGSADSLSVTALTDSTAGLTPEKARVQAVNLGSSPVDFALDDTVIAAGLESLSTGEAVDVDPGTYALGSSEKTLLGGTLYSLVFFDGAVIVEETPLSVGLNSLPGVVEVAAAVTQEATEEAAAATEEATEEPVATEEVAEAEPTAIAAEATPAEAAASTEATPQVIIVTATPDPNQPTPTPVIIVVTATPESQQALPTPVAPVATVAVATQPVVAATTAPVAPGGSLLAALCSPKDVVCGLTNIDQNAKLQCREYPSTQAFAYEGIPNSQELFINGVAGPRDETGEIGVTYAITVEGLPDFTELAGPDFSVANFTEDFLLNLQISDFWLYVDWEPQPGALFSCWVRADYVQIRYLGKLFDDPIEYLDLIDSGIWELIPYNVPAGPKEISPQQLNQAQQGAAPVNVFQPSATAVTASGPQVVGQLLISPGQTLNLRTIPTSDGQILFAIPAETNGRPTTVAVIGRTQAGDWLKVTYNTPTGTIEGWIASQFLQLNFNNQPYDINSLPVVP